MCVLKVSERRPHLWWHSSVTADRCSSLLIIRTLVDNLWARALSFTYRLVVLAGAELKTLNDLSLCLSSQPKAQILCCGILTPFSLWKPMEFFKTRRPTRQFRSLPQWSQFCEPLRSDLRRLLALFSLPSDSRDRKLARRWPLARVIFPRQAPWLRLLLQGLHGELTAKRADGERSIADWLGQALITIAELERCCLHLTEEIQGFAEIV